MLITYQETALKIWLASGILFAMLALPPSGIAGGAFTLVTDDDRDIPQGSLIPQHRIEKIEKLVAEQQAKQQDSDATSPQATRPSEPATSH